MQFGLKLNTKLQNCPELTSKLTDDVEQISFPSLPLIGKEAT